MTEIRSWLSEPLDRQVARALQRLAEAPGVRRVAVMPDVHLSRDVCVGTVLATDAIVYPQAVGGDIGCGMATARIGADVGLLHAPAAEAVLGDLKHAVPIVRHARARDAPHVERLDAGLRRRVVRDARVQFATLGRGNHFVELQADECGELWLAVHSGSRALGPAIRDHHLRGRRGLVGLRGGEAAGYLRDHDLAVGFAQASRRAMAVAVEQRLRERFGVELDWSTWFDVTHNFVRHEVHDGESLMVHRKGACSADAGERGIIPGSMGTATFHVEGRGCAAALRSSSHGAGRRLPRGEAMRRISPQQLERQLHGVAFDRSLARRLCDEAPRAYRDIGKVMRAQRELVRIVRTLAPVLSYKGG
jgi:tRNA-splicing ligase RtcB